MITKNTAARRTTKKLRIRKKIAGTSERPRLTVYRSLKHIYAQIVDDSKSQTLVFTSSRAKELQEQVKAAGSPVEVGRIVGKVTAQRALAKNITQVVFDRNGLLYHGRVKAVAEGAREGGLKF
jgi:large subunit ribosomal protein L18